MADPASSTSAEPQGATPSDVARGLGPAFLARTGAIIEAVSQPAFVWMFGLADYGLYVVLWAAVSIAAQVANFAMPQVLQRLVPGGEADRAHAAVRLAVILPLLPVCLLSLAVSLAPDSVAPLVSATAAQQAALPAIVALFVWTLPLAILLDVTTGAARARRAFGPEIRLRIFWEQIFRLGLAVGLWLAGFGIFALFAAHLMSLAIAALLSIRLLGRYFELPRLLGAPAPRALWWEMMVTGLAFLPPALMRRAFNDLPPILLNGILSGSAGVTSAGLYGIARKVASIPLIVRQSFLYVLAPLSSAQARVDRAAIAPLFHFANRVAVLIVMPLGVALLLIAESVLRIFSPEAAPALPVVLILVVGRMAESAFGAATPIVEMTGHRALPLANSLAGLALWVVLALIFVPGMGATGMAIAVSAGVTLTALLAVAQLQWADGIAQFAGGWWRALAIATGAAGILLPLDFAARVAGDLAADGLVLAAVLPATWLALKLGLQGEDRAALGGFGRRLRL